MHHQPVFSQARLIRYFSDISEDRSCVVLGKYCMCSTFLFCRLSPDHWQQQKLITFARSVKETVLSNWWKLWQKSTPITLGKGYNPSISLCINESRNNLNRVIESYWFWINVGLIFQGRVRWVCEEAAIGSRRLSKWYGHGWNRASSDWDDLQRSESKDV